MDPEGHAASTAAEISNIFADQFEILSTIVYLAMSWMILVATMPLYRALHGGGVGWLAAGGLRCLLRPGRRLLGEAQPEVPPRHPAPVRNQGEHLPGGRRPRLGQPLGLIAKVMDVENPPDVVRAAHSTNLSTSKWLHEKKVYLSFLLKPIF